MGLFSKNGKLLVDGARLRGCCCGFGLFRQLDLYPCSVSPHSGTLEARGANYWILPNGGATAASGAAWTFSGNPGIIVTPIGNYSSLAVVDAIISQYGATMDAFAEQALRCSRTEADNWVVSLWGASVLHDGPPTPEEWGGSALEYNFDTTRNGKPIDVYIWIDYVRGVGSVTATWTSNSASGTVVQTPVKPSAPTLTIPPCSTDTIRISATVSGTLPHPTQEQVFGFFGTTDSTATACHQADYNSALAALMAIPSSDQQAARARVALAQGMEGEQ